jgi:hypothetical protein
VPRRPERILLLGIVGQYPMAGVAWQAINYLLGLRALGWDVFYVEDSGAPPYDPRTGGRTDDCGYAVRYLDDVMRRIGCGERWVYLDMARNETHGRSRAELADLYRTATAIVNLCGATGPREEHRRGARLLYVETDPVYEQLRIASGEATSTEFLAAHDVLFTYGENLGAADCPVPLVRFAWHPTRPPVVVEQWPYRPDPGAAGFTSIASWENKGKDITFGGVTYQWSKHVNFLRVIDLPRLATGQRFRLAMDPGTPVVAARLADAGWELTDPRPISCDIDVYRDFIAASRGEFTVAKDIYVRPRSGWFSDRSVCYLAAGKPVVTQDTGVGKFVPSGEGLLLFDTPEEAREALARVDADYLRHCAAARAVASEHFAADRVLGRLLADAGLG